MLALTHRQVGSMAFPWGFSLFLALYWDKSLGMRLSPQWDCVLLEAGTLPQSSLHPQCPVQPGMQQALKMVRSVYLNRLSFLSSLARQM